jgi:hypothetical protein
MRGRVSQRRPRRGIGNRNRAWYKTNADRLEQDKALLREAYPTLAFFVDEVVQRVWIEGMLLLRADCGITEEIHIRIDYPDEYPRRLPTAGDPARRFERSPDSHVNRDGSFCLTFPLDQEFDLQSAELIVDFVDAVALFVERLLIYEVTGRWPGPAWGHGVAAWRECVERELGTTDSESIARLLELAGAASSLSRNAECPCGSGRKYKHCHLPSVRVLQAKLRGVS